MFLLTHINIIEYILFIKTLIDFPLYNEILRSLAVVLDSGPLDMRGLIINAALYINWLQGALIFRGAICDLGLYVRPPL